MSAPTTAPRSYPFWMVLAACWLIVGFTMARAQSMGLFMPPMTQALGIGREGFGLAMAVSQLMMGVFAPMTGGLIDHYGAGRIVVIAVALGMLGLGFFYAATSVVHLLAGGFLLGVAASGTGVTSLVGTVGRLAPPERRMSAIASLGMAGGIAGFMGLPVVHLLIEAFGWKGTLAILLFASLAVLPMVIPILPKPAPVSGIDRDQTARAALAEAFAHPSFWFLTAGFFVCGFHVAFIMVHLPAFAIDKGLPSWVGPAALSLVGIANIIGTFAAGQSGKYIEKRRALSLIYFGRALVFCGFLFLPMTPVTIIGLSGLLGLLWLATIPLTSGLVATFFGTQWMSMLFGIVFLSHQVGSFLGVWLAGRLFDMSRSYDTMWWLSIALGVIAGLANWPIQERPVARLRNRAVAA